MEVTYLLSETEFDQNVFESIKIAFKNRLMKISIVAEETTNVVSEKTHNDDEITVYSLRRHYE